MKIIETLDAKYIIVEKATMDDVLRMIVMDYRKRVFRSFMNEEKLRNYLQKKFTMPDINQELIDEMITEFKETLNKPVDVEFYKPIMDRIKENEYIFFVPEGLLFYKEVEEIICWVYDGFIHQ